MRHNEVYDIKKYVDRENKKLNRNAYHALRSWLLNTCLQITAFTNQNFHFSVSLIF